MADQALNRRRAWDCATGGGQAAVRLAVRFEEVLATDTSPEQIEHGLQHERVRHTVAPSHDSGIDGGSLREGVSADDLLEVFDDLALGRGDLG